MHTNLTKRGVNYRMNLKKKKKEERFVKYLKVLKLDASVNNTEGESGSSSDLPMN